MFALVMRILILICLSIAAFKLIKATKLAQENADGGEIAQKINHSVIAGSAAIVIALVLYFVNGCPEITENHSLPWLLILRF